MSTDLDIDVKRSAAARRAIVKIHYGQIGMIQLRIGTTDTGALLDELTGRVATAPKFFQRTAVCLDLSDLSTMPGIDELRAVIEAVRRAGMLTVGLTGGLAELQALSNALDLPILSAFRASNNPFPAVKAGPTAAAPALPVAATVTAAAATVTTGAGTVPQVAHTPAPVAALLPPTAANAPRIPDTETAAAATVTTGAATVPPPAPAATPAEQRLPTMIQNQPVRSGQRIYARGRDLVITAGVGAGAEVMADGCVHIYGSLRGRAMAGVHGQLNARVFCQEFNAELVSIAGVFRVFETIPPELVGKPVQAWLDGDDLHFALVGN